MTLFVAVLVIAAAVAAVLRGLDVRLALTAAALLLGLIAGDPAPVVREFLATFSSEKFVVPICSAMGFAYVLKHTGCDQHLVRVLVAPVRRVRWLLIPGVVLIGFTVNIPVISQTSTAVCLGTVVVPLMRAAGLANVTIGAALLLGASVGGELLNPGAPELLTVSKLTDVPTPQMWGPVLKLVLPMLAVATALFWVQELVWGPAADATAATPEADAGPVNPLQAVVPLVPLALLFVTGPPFEFVTLDPRWVVGDGEGKLANSRLIGLAMLVGVAAAAAAAPRQAGGCMKAFFDGAGYGFTHVVSLIVVATCFGKGIEQVGLAKVLGSLIAGRPELLHPLAGGIPMVFAFVCGSGMASTQSLYGFFHAPAVELQQDPVAVGAMVSLGSAAGRTMSPVAAVVLMCGTLVGVKPFALVGRVAGPLLGGLAVVIALRLAGVV